MSTDGYFLPNAKSPIINKEFIEEVKAGKCWVAKTIEITFLDCALPPNMIALKKMLTKKLTEENNSDEFKRLGKHLKNSLADRPWMLGMLSLLDPGSHIF